MFSHLFFLHFHHYTDKSTVCNWCHISLVNKKSIIFKKIILMKSFHICWFSSSIVLWNITPILDIFLHFSPLLNTPYLIIYNLISFETFFLSLYQWVNSLVLPLGNPWENILPCGQLVYTKDLLNSMTLWCGVDIMEFQHDEFIIELALWSYQWQYETVFIIFGHM